MQLPEGLRVVCPQVCERSMSPRWDEAFHFLVRDPRDEILTVKVRETVSTCSSWLCGGYAHPIDSVLPFFNWL